MRTWVTVRTQVEGFHHWPTPTSRRDYLGESHRHMFHVEHSVAVDDPDRAIEFHDLLATVRDTLSWLFSVSDLPGLRFGPRSCEHIAIELSTALRPRLRLGDNVPMRCRVFEDGENGAEVETP